MKTPIAIQFRVFVAVFFLGGVSLPAATNWVYNTNNSGPGSLHAAITNANATGGVTNYIYFNITNSGPGPFTIRPTSQLPSLGGTVVINGYTQPGASPNTNAVGTNAVLLIELDGINAPGINTDGLQNGGAVTFRGLVINRFKRHGINHLNFTAGTIQGCFIGTDTSGMTNAGNGGNGILISGVSCITGGTNAADRNVISGNGGAGIATGRDFHVIQNNYIGTDKTVTNALGNGGNGVAFSNTDAGFIGSTNNPVAGRNVISGNGGAGIDLGFDPKNFVVGNYIGTDAKGVSRAGFGNVGNGILVSGGNSNVIGGTIAGRGNLIAGNGGDGVAVSGEVEPGFFTNGVANAILGNSIYGNGSSVSSDGKIGIDLLLIFTSGEVSTNDPCDLDYDNGGNRLQNFPVLTGATSTTSNITIAGTLNSAPSTNYLLEFFQNSQCDPSGFGEGETFIGRTNFVAGADCTNAFVFTFPVAVAGGKFITATASRLLTNSFYETSEFSQCITNVGTATPSAVTIISTALQGNNLCLTWTAPGGTTNFVQAAATVTNVFTNISPPIVLALAQTTTKYCDPGALTNRSARLYRILVQN